MDTAAAASILYCFAVKQEAGPFKPSGVDRMIFTGMGQVRARIAVDCALASFTPGLVVTAGTAGALRAGLCHGDIVFESDRESRLAEILHSLGGIPGRFHCSPRVVARADEKQALGQSVGADAVEMESSAIHQVCRARKVPCATVRVISDVASEDLPMDFNEIMTPTLEISFLRLGGMLLRRPSLVPGLIRFQKGLGQSAEKLADFLYRLGATMQESCPRNTRKETRRD